VTGPPSAAVLRQIDGLRSAVPGCQVEIALLVPGGEAALVIYTPPAHDLALADDDLPDWARVSTPSLLWVLAPTCREPTH